MSLLVLSSSRTASSGAIQLITRLTPRMQEERIKAFGKRYDAIKNSRSATAFNALFDEMIGFWQRNCTFLDTQSKNDLLELILIAAIEKIDRFSFVNDDSPALLFSLFSELYEQGASPNTFIEKILIGDNEFGNVEFFQIVYLCWKILYNSPLQADTDQDYSHLFTRMISDHRTDLTANFFESFTGFGHFVSDSNRRFSPGYTFESTTLAHYALAIKDLTSVMQMIELDNRLITSKCKMMSGKALLSEFVIDVSKIAQERFSSTSSERSDCSETDSDSNYSDYDETDSDSEYSDTDFNWNIRETEAIVDWDLRRIREISEELQYLHPEDPISGVLASAAYGHDYPFEDVSRITEISLLHIAARNADIHSCYFLFGKNSDILEVDSFKATPLAYLQQSCKESLVHETALEAIPILRPRAPVLRRTLPTASHIILKSGYEILYNPAFKTAYYSHEILTLRSLSPSDGTRSGHSFLVEKTVSKLNRASDNDYTKSGLDRGHLRAAANTSNDREIADSFYLSNICPQDRKLNQGYWKKLEALIRREVFTNDVVEVYTGPVFDLDKQPFRKIGKNKLPVPTDFFKVIHRHNRTSTTVAFMIPNSPIDGATKLQSFRVTLRKIQELTGISFAIAARTA